VRQPLWKDAAARFCNSFAGEFGHTVQRTVPKSVEHESFRSWQPSRLHASSYETGISTRGKDCEKGGPRRAIVPRPCVARTPCGLGSFGGMPGPQLYATLLHSAASYARDGTNFNQVR